MSVSSTSPAYVFSRIEGLHLCIRESLAVPFSGGCTFVSCPWSGALRVVRKEVLFSFVLEADNQAVYSGASSLHRSLRFYSLACHVLILCCRSLNVHVDATRSGSEVLSSRSQKRAEDVKAIRLPSSLLRFSCTFLWLNFSPAALCASSCRLIDSLRKTVDVVAEWFFCKISRFLDPDL
jgi:hypothetical protein